MDEVVVVQPSAEPAPGADAASPWWRRPSLLLPAGIVLAAGFLRFWALDRPAELMPLDETYYVPDAREIIQSGSETDFVVHPNVGKWMIAAGIKLFGDNAVGWRASAALLGTLGILLVYLIAMRLWRSRTLAAVAAFLLGIEGLWLVQSRIAMLDMYMAFFALLGVWLLVEDRERAGGEHRGPRWWRLGSGFAFGLALSSKFLAIAPIIVAALGLAAAWELTRSRRIEASRRDQARQVVAILATFVVLPPVVYAASWVPWLVDSTRYLPPRCESSGNPVSGWMCYQREIYSFHSNLQKFQDDGQVGHPYFGEAWAWPWIGRPVAHYYEVRGEGAAQQDAEVLGLPNPVIWWPAFFVAVPMVGWWALRRRDGTAAFIALFVAAGYLPLLELGFFDRPIFFFYATPIVPFLVLALVHLFHRLFLGTRRRRVVLAAYLVAAVGALAFFYPVLTGIEIPHDGPFGWRSRIWFDSDCTAQGVKNFCWI